AHGFSNAPLGARPGFLSATGEQKLPTEAVQLGVVEALACLALHVQRGVDEPARLLQASRSCARAREQAGAVRTKQAGAGRLGRACAGRDRCTAFVNVAVVALRGSPEEQ